jgi:CheY-like chemotaxis protein
MNKEKAATILVVEDSLPMRKALVETLKVLNYNTLEAQNGLEALQIIDRARRGEMDIPGNQVSLIMSDLSMPEMDGQELFYTLKMRGNGIPMVMLTGFMVTDELDELREKGLAGWLLKPADIDQIAEMLDKLIT